MHLLTFLFISR